MIDPALVLNAILVASVSTVLGFILGKMLFEISRKWHKPKKKEKC